MIYLTVKIVNKRTECQLSSVKQFGEPIKTLLQLQKKTAELVLQAPPSQKKFIRPQVQAILLQLPHNLL